MLSATAIEETHWPTTQFDLPADDDAAFLFSELISSKARQKAPASEEGEKKENDEELQKETSFLSDQWRQHEVTQRIARLKTSTGEKIASRLAALRDMLKEEEGNAADISPESLRSLQLFLQTADNIGLPEITLIPKAEVYLR